MSPSILPDRDDPAWEALKERVSREDAQSALTRVNHNAYDTDTDTWCVFPFNNDQCRWTSYAGKLASPFNVLYWPNRDALLDDVRRVYPTGGHRAAQVWDEAYLAGVARWAMYTINDLTTATVEPTRPWGRVLRDFLTDPLSMKPHPAMTRWDAMMARADAFEVRAFRLWRLHAEFEPGTRPGKEILDAAQTSWDSLVRDITVEVGVAESLVQEKHAADEHARKSQRELSDRKFVERRRRTETAVMADALGTPQPSLEP